MYSNNTNILYILNQKSIILKNKLLIIYTKTQDFNKKFEYKMAKNQIMSYIILLSKNMKKNYSKIIVKGYYTNILGNMVILFYDKNKQISSLIKNYYQSSFIKG